MSPRIKIILVSLVVLVGLGAAGIWWYLRDDSPPEVTLDAAVESVEGDTGDAGSAAGVDGTWTVDVTTGDFDYESATGTFVGFRIAEELASIGKTEAVGRTGDVTGQITIDGTSLTDATFEAEMTTITTNESRRDDKVQQALETTAFATASFSLTEPVELGAEAASGASVAVVAVGDLTVHGVTKPIEIPLEAKLVDGTVVVVGSTDITFSDFGVEVPSAPIVVSAEDHGTLELQLLLTRA